MGTRVVRRYYTRRHHLVDLKSSTVKYCQQGNVNLCRCLDLVWYKRWWNTAKGWFGSKVTNCLKANAAEVLLSSKVQKLCSALEWYKRWWNTIKGWFGSKPTNCRQMKSAFYDKFGKIVNEGLALDLYTPHPTTVLAKLPSFTDDAPLNQRVSFYNEFAKAKSALLGYHHLDAQFLNLVENYVKTWAITPEQELNKLHEALTQDKKQESKVEEVKEDKKIEEVKEENKEEQKTEA